jgi:hypothetical protein
MKEKLESQLSKITDESKLLVMLRETIPFMAIRDLKQIPISIIKRLHQIPPEYLNYLAKRNYLMVNKAAATDPFDFPLTYQSLYLTASTHYGLCIMLIRTVTFQLLIYCTALRRMFLWQSGVKHGSPTQPYSLWPLTAIVEAA